MEMLGYQLILAHALRNSCVALGLLDLANIPSMELENRFLMTIKR